MQVGCDASVHPLKSQRVKYYYSIVLAGEAHESLASNAKTYHDSLRASSAKFALQQVPTTYRSRYLGREVLLRLHMNIRT